MPITKSAKKALRGSLRKAEVNRRIKSRVKTVIDKFKTEPTQTNLTKAYSAIDRAVKGNIFHRNKGARMKSRLAKFLLAKGVSKKVEKVKKTAKPKKSVAKKSTIKKIVKTKKIAKPKKIIKKSAVTKSTKKAAPKKTTKKASTKVKKSQ